MNAAWREVAAKPGVVVAEIVSRIQGIFHDENLHIVATSAQNACDCQAVAAIVPLAAKDGDRAGIDILITKPSYKCLRGALHEVDGGNRLVCDCVGVHRPDLFYIENLHDNRAKSFLLPTNSARFALVFSKAVLNEGASPRPLGASYHFKSIKSLVMSELIKLVEATIENRKSEYPDFKSGDTINVHVKIREGNKERIQQFQGTVMQRRNVNGSGETFTVRKISNGIGVERVFPILSPSIAKIELIRRGKVRRSRLFFLRGRQGKAARIKELKTTK